MLSEKLQKALNDQINAEFSSAYQYLAMAAWFQSMNLEGSARWMRRQAGEEVGHAMKIYDFVNDRDGRALLAAVREPTAQFESPLAAWEAALKQEQEVTRRINALYALAGAENDYSAQVMLQWFVSEQVEEEKTAKGIVEQVRMIGPGSALFFIDRHLGKEAEGKPEEKPS